MSTAKKKNKITTRRAILLRSYIVFGIAVIFAFLILWRAGGLMLGKNKKISEAINEKNSRVVNVKATRGNIYAEDGSLLATTVPSYDLVVDANAEGLTNEIIDEKLDSLTRFFAGWFPEKNPEQWKQFFTSLRKKQSHYHLVLKDLNFEQVKRMKRWPIITLGKFKGFWFEEKGKRMVFMGDLAKRTIGIVRDTNAVGLEGSFDSLLRGKNGKRVEQKMPGNVWRPITVGNVQEPENGYDLVTTLDVNLQDVATYSLNKNLIANEASHGCAIVMETETGAIRAMANLHKGKDGKYYETYNYAVDEFSDPGSTFKLVSVLALIDDGYCKPTDSVDVNWGETLIYGKPMKDASKPPKRILTLSESFQYSSNIGISKLIIKHYENQPEKFISRINSLGLNMKPDFDIKGAKNPLIPTPRYKTWSKMSLPMMSIGYEMKVSPLQMLMVYNAVANNGKLMRPYMVKELKLEGRSIKKIEPKVLNEKVCSPQTIAILKTMMENVVEKGTAKNIKSNIYKIAGKTSTAQIFRIAAGYDKNSYKAGFCGYFPANNPKYTIIVTITEPKKGAYYGALVAGPVFKDISDRIYATHTNVQPVAVQASSLIPPFVLRGNIQKTQSSLTTLGIKLVIDSTEANSLFANYRNKELRLVQTSINQQDGKMPDTKGMGLRDAVAILENRKIIVKYSGFGRVVSQSVLPGTAISGGTTVILKLEPF